jgi:hypothetical protein
MINRPAPPPVRSNASGGCPRVRLTPEFALD